MLDWNRSDIFIMTPTTPGVGGSLARWPDQLLNPHKYGKNIIIFLPGDYTTRKDGNNALGVLYPVQSGTAAQPIRYIAVEGMNYQIDDDPTVCTAPHPTARPAANLVKLGAFWAMSHDYLTCEGFKLTGTGGVSLIHASQHAVVSNIDASNIPKAWLRVRYGSCDFLVDRCLAYRHPPISTTDTEAIQFVDGANLRGEVRDSVFINYTDNMQTTGRRQTDGRITDYGFAAGLKFTRCVFGCTSEVYTNAGKESVRGIENAIDLKVGGTPTLPVQFNQCTIFGYRPNIGSPGYAVTFHDVCTDIQFNGTRIVDCEAAIFLNAAYLYDLPPPSPWQNFRLTMDGCLFSDIHAHGSTLFPQDQGCIIVGNNVGTIRNSTICFSDKLASLLPTSQALATGPLDMTGTLLHLPCDFGAYAGHALPQGLQVVDENWAGPRYTDAVEQFAVPFTSIIVPIRYKKTILQAYIDNPAPTPADDAAALAELDRLNAGSPVAMLKQLCAARLAA